MNKKHLSITCLVILVITLACVLSGCRGENDIFNGKYEVTFNLNGGTLDYKTSSVNTEIKYAYVPNTYVIAVNDIPGYKLFKDGYVFSGWYTSEACNPGDEWDFDGKVLDFDGLVLYAGWEKATVYSYTVYYTDGDKDVALGSYNVKAGAAFSDWRKFAEKRDGYTSIGYFSDRDCTTPWDSETVHPGGEVDLDIPVYVDFIEGKWHLVSNMDQLADAVASNDNVYLTGDIDCGGEALSFGTAYSAIFEGNGYAVTNFKVTATSNLRKPACAIFSALGDGAIVRNVSFTNVSYDITNINLEALTEIKFAALAVSAGKVTVQNVTVTGAVSTKYTGELAKLNSAFYEEKETPTPEGFSATVTLTVVD